MPYIFLKTDTLGKTYGTYGTYGTSSGSNSMCQKAAHEKCVTSFEKAFLMYVGNNEKGYKWLIEQNSNVDLNCCNCNEPLFD